MENSTSNSAQVDGNNNIVIQGVSGQNIEININQTAEVVQIVNRLKTELATANAAKTALLQNNIAILENILQADHYTPSLEADEFAADIDRLTNGFLGRHHEIETITAFVNHHHQGSFFIIGSPGIGKSSLAAKVAAELTAQEKLHILPYFIRRGTESAQLSAFFTHLNQQLEAYLQTGLPMGNTIEQLRGGLHQRLKRNADRRLVIIIDGLDEGAETGIVNELSSQLYPNTLFIFSSRLTDEVETKMFQFRNLPYYQELRLGGLAEEVLYSLVEKIADNFTIDSELIAPIANNSQGNPKYLELLSLSLRKGMVTIRKAADIPNFTDDFENFYAPLLKSYTKSQDGNMILSALFCLAAAKDYLSKVQLLKILQIGSGDIGRVLIVLQEVLIEKRGKNDTRFYQIFHESLREYLVQREYDQLLETKYTLLEFCEKWQAFRNPYLKDYPLRHFATHLHELALQEQDIQAKNELWELAQNQIFIDQQIQLTEQYFVSFNLCEKSMQLAQLEHNLEESLAIGLRLVKLHDLQNNDHLRTIEWARNGSAIAVDKALRRLEGLSIQEQVQTYAVLLYHQFHGIRSGQHEQAEIVSQIVEHLDLNLERKGDEFSDFSYWYYLLLQCKRIGVTTDFFEGRAGEAAFTDRVESTSNQSLVEKIIQQAEETHELEQLELTIWHILGTNSGFGSSYSAWIFQQHLTSLIERLITLGRKEEIYRIETQLEEARERITQVVDSTEKFLIEDSLAIVRITISLLLGKFEDAFAHYQDIRDISNAIAAMRRLLKFALKQELHDEALAVGTIMKEVAEPLLARVDQRDAVRFYCEIAVLADEIYYEAPYSTQMLVSAWECIKEGDRNDTGLRKLCATIIRLNNLPDEAYQTFAPLLLPMKAVQYPKDSTDAVTPLLKNWYEIDGYDILDRLEKHFNTLHYLDVLTQVAKAFAEEENFLLVAEILRYVDRQIEMYSRQNKNTETASQLYRFKLTVGALKLSYDVEAGQQLLEEVFAMEEKEYISPNIVFLSKIEALPLLYKYDCQEKGELLKQDILESIDDPGRGELYYKAFIKSLLMIDEGEMAIDRYKALILKNGTDYFSKAIIQLFIDAGMLAELKSIPFTNKTLSALDQFIFTEHQPVFCEIFNDYFEQQLGQLEPYEITGRESIVEHYYQGLIQNNEKGKAIDLIAKYPFDTTAIGRSLAISIIEDDLKSLEKIIADIGTLYTAIVYDFAQNCWLGVTSDDSNRAEQIYNTAEEGLYYSLSVALVNKDSLFLAKKVREITMDYDERNRIGRGIALALLKKGAYQQGLAFIAQEMIKSENIYFWQKVITILANEVAQVKKAANLLGRIEQCKDSSLNEKRLDSYQEVACQLLRHGEYDLAFEVIQKTAKFSADSGESTRKSKAIRFMIASLATQGININDEEQLAQWITDWSLTLRTQLELDKYTPWLFFYSRQYQKALEFSKRVEDESFRDFYLLYNMSLALLWNGQLDKGIVFLQNIIDENHLDLPLEEAIRFLLKDARIKDALQLLKSKTRFHNNALLVENIIESADKNDLHLIWHFLVMEIELEDEKLKQRYIQYFIAKLGAYSDQIQPWMGRLLIQNINHAQSLGASLFLAHVAGDLPAFDLPEN